MKRMAFLIVLLGFLLPAFSQIKPFSIGPYVEKAYLKGDAAERWKDAWGLGLTADIRLPGKWGLTGSAGYWNAPGRTLEGTREPSLTAVPVRMGLKFRAIPGFYLKAEGGYARLTEAGGRSLIFSPGIGVRLLSFDLQAKLEQWWGDADVKSWGLRLAFHF